MAEVNDNVKELDLVTTTMSNKSASHAGCNSFALVTTEDVDGKPAPVMCTGLLTELPSFSISPNYDLSPGKTVLDLYTDVFKKDEFDVAAVLMSASNNSDINGTTEWHNTIQAGAMTRGMFKSVSYGDFNLKFKIYEQNQFGQSSVSDWKALLSKLAVPNRYAATSSTALLDNIDGALKAMTSGGERIIQELTKGRVTKVEPGKYEKKRALILWKMQQACYLLGEYCNILSEGFASVVGIEFALFTTGEVSASAKSKTFVPQFKITLAGNFANNSYIHRNSKGKTYLGLTAELSNGSNRDLAYWFRLPHGTVALNDNNYTKYIQDFNETDFYKNNIGTGGEKNFKNVLLNTLLDNGYLELLKNLEQKAKAANKNDLAETIHSQYTKRLDQGNGAAATIRTRLDAVASKLWKYLTADSVEEQSDFFSNIAEHSKNILNNVQYFISNSGFLNNYGKDRVYEEMNRKTRMGEKLWHLYIYYPWFFNTPITVCITDWSFTPSKQLNIAKNPVYYEVEIKCKMDQLPSKQTWQDMFSKICKIAANN